MKNIKHLLTLVITIFIVTVTEAQPNFDWVGHNEGIVLTEIITTDLSGNTLINYIKFKTIKS